MTSTVSKANRIPEQGLSREAVFEQLERFTAQDWDWRAGKAFAYTFDGGAEAEAVGKQAFMDFMSKNALDPTFFPSVLELENRVVAMAAAHLGGDEQTVGAFTSGGTESIILAVKTARDYFRAVRPEITEPEMLLPVTAHAAFHKAGRYLGVKCVLVDVDPVSFRADPEATARAIGPNTILLVGSASSYAHGVVDPIAALGQLAQEHGLLLHVDGCIGGFLLPYFKRFGAQVPDFDFSVPGVTSISMDFHKYCYAPKGASVVLMKSLELRRHQLFACATWTGYTVVDTTVQSTKSAGAMAGAWAVLSFLGDAGYERIARGLYDATQQLVAGIEAIPQLRVLGRPELPLIAFTSDQINIFAVIDEMKELGWYIQPQLKYGQHRENIHLSVNPGNVPHVDALLADLRRVCAKVKAKPGSKIASVVAATFGRLDPDKLSDAIFAKLIGMAGIQSVGVPESMAEINDVMNALPPKLSERLLIEYVNRLFVQPGVDATRGIGKQRHVLPTGPRPGNGHAAPPPAWAALPGVARAQALARGVRQRLVDLGLPLGRA